MAGIERVIDDIKKRNSRVEADKAWETSWTRRSIIAAGTYALSALLLFLINAPNPFFAALVPALGFMLSTMTLPIFKGWWLSGRKAEGR
jgi:polyferredoxin